MADVPTLRRPFQAVDHEALMRRHAPPPEYFEGDWLLDPDRLAERQLAALRDRAQRAYRVPFFRKRWDAVGFHPDQLQTLDDLSRAPAYKVDDIRESVEQSPPLGDYQGAALESAVEEPLRIFMSGATTGTGAVTSSRRQVELAHQYQATAILTTGDYLLHLAEVARDMGLDPKKALNLKALPNIGDRAVLEDTFGVPNYQSYGFHEVQWVSVECPARQGLHIFEDAFVVEIVDPETGEPLPEGETGCICITETYKTGSPQFRYNIQDLSFLHPREQCECGSWLRRMGPFAGRADNMVKLRGVNVWPEAIGEIALDDPRLEHDYFVRAVRDGHRDEMIVHLTTRAGAREHEPLAVAAEARLKERLGVRIQARVAATGSLDECTEIHTSPKPKRFRDERTG
jgi:phenylacetate-coenzyme A ligase PaaK-like adenylate-forming protein